MHRTLTFGMILVALTILGLVGLGFLFAPGGPSFANARLELGGALVSGVVLSGAFLAAERRLETEDRQHERHTLERQIQEQYQLALTMERDLTDRDLSGLNLAGLQLRLRDLNKSRLTEADLTGANLIEANLTEAILYRTILTGADLWQAKMVKSNLVEADFTGAHLLWADLTGANMTKAILTGATLTGSDLTGANLTESILIGAKWNPQYPPIWPDDFDSPGNSWSARNAGNG